MLVVIVVVVVALLIIGAVVWRLDWDTPPDDGKDKDKGPWPD